MKRLTLLCASLLMLVFSGLVLMGASASQKSTTATDESGQGFQRNTSQPDLTPPIGPEVDDVEVAETAGSAAAFQLDWYSINGGGTIEASSTNYKMGLSVGQSVAGEASSANYTVGVGFWYGTVSSLPPECLIVIAGDVDVSTSITSADIIYLVNFVFKGGAVPLPCEANGDVNCSGSVTSGDIIYLVNFVFKGDAAPCDICNEPGAQECTP